MKPDWNYFGVFYIYNYYQQPENFFTQARPEYMASEQATGTRNQVQIPYLPLLGPHSFAQIIQDIYRAIVDETTAAEFYSRLLKEAPDELHREFIEHAM